MNQIDIIRKIVQERSRQDDLHIENNVDDYLAIFIEECLEVLKAIQEDDKENLIEELIQVAAVTVRWMESL